MPNKRDVYSDLPTFKEMRMMNKLSYVTNYMAQTRVIYADRPTCETHSGILVSQPTYDTKVPHVCTMHACYFV